MRDLNQAGLKMQTVNDHLTMYVGAASQHALRTTSVPREEAVSFDEKIVASWSQLDPTLMAATDSPDTDSLLAATPTPRGQLLHLQSTLGHQMNTPALLLKTPGCRSAHTWSQRTLVSAIQRTTHTHTQIMDAHVDNSIKRAILISQTAKNTGTPSAT